ncbi:MAG TPA: DUF6279 family lipoprotein [Noviherbaspirillum sp.]
MLLAAFLLVSLLAGCSALRIGYANGETVAYWWLDGYADIDHDQKPWVKADIRNYFAWHRKTQLRDYAQLLSRTGQRLQQKVTPADVQADYLMLRQRAMLAVDHALPELADLALSLKPEQIAHIERKFASNNDTYRKDYLRGSLEDRQAFRFKKALKQAEYWFGDFSREQEAQIRAASNARPLNNEIWLDERRHRQQAILKLLRRIQAEQPSREAAIAMMREQLPQLFDFMPYNEHKEFFDASRDGTFRLVATVINIATPAQREFARRRLQKLIEDCNTMTAQ